MIRGPGRASRIGGTARVFDALGPYSDRVADQFHGFEPVDIGAAGMPASVQEVWSRIADRTEVRLHPTGGSVRFDHGEPTVSSIRPLLDEIVRRRWAGGVVFGPSGQQLWVVDRQSGLVPTRDVCQWAVSGPARERPDAQPQAVVFESSMWMDFSLCSARLSFCSDTTEQLVRQMRRMKATIGADGQGRLWTAGPEIRCDAFWTVALAARVWSGRQSQDPAA
jgi:hypothetical protein